ncbi:MAG: Mut7-C RNAse domain-containing protein [Bacteroidota bacterium]
MKLKEATFRFYEELNDFLPETKKKARFVYYFKGKPTVKDAIQAIGIPHVEVDLILLNGHSVTLDAHLNNNDDVSVYPVFETFDISGITRLRPEPSREPMFILDVHLGKLAKYLRFLGFDTLYRNDYHDHQIVKIAKVEKRIVLTRDTGILKIDEVQRGYFLRSKDPLEQVKEITEHFQLASKFRPFTRCSACNGKMKKVKKEEIVDHLEPLTRVHFDEFYRCGECGKIYWKGSHYVKIKQFIEGLSDV